MSNYGHGVDEWAFSCIMWEIFTCGDILFQVGRFDFDLVSEEYMKNNVPGIAIWTPRNIREFS